MPTSSATPKSLVVRTGDNDSLLESPYISLVTGSEVDLKALPVADIEFEMYPERVKFVKDDQLILTVAGSTANGELLSVEVTAAVVTLGRPVKFTVPYAILAYMTNSKGNAFYKKGGPTGVLSQNYSFSVSGDPIVLPVPQVSDAIDGALNAKGLTADPSVTVAPWPYIKEKQQFSLTVESVAADGTLQPFKTFTGTVDANIVKNGLKFPLSYTDLQALPAGFTLNISHRVILGGGSDLIHAINYPTVNIKLSTQLDDFTDFKNGMNGWINSNGEKGAVGFAGSRGRLVNTGTEWVFEDDMAPYGAVPLIKYFEFTKGKEYVGSCKVRNITDSANVVQPYLDIRSQGKAGTGMTVPRDGKWHTLSVTFVATRINDHIAIYMATGGSGGNGYQIKELSVKEIIPVAL